VSSPLRKLLEEEAGWEEFQMIIPHPFLPPRFQNLSENRNMILLLDRDMTLHVRWEGSRIHEHHPLTPGAVNRLVKEVLRKMSKYRGELEVFNRFIQRNAEQPFDDPRALDPIRFKVRKLPPAGKIEEKEDTAIEVTARIQLPSPELGGESPMGPMEEEFYG